jgi:hypothetical protein
MFATARRLLKLQINSLRIPSYFGESLQSLRTLINGPSNLYRKTSTKMGGYRAPPDVPISEEPIHLVIRRPSSPSTPPRDPVVLSTLTDPEGVWNFYPTEPVPNTTLAVVLTDPTLTPEEINSEEIDPTAYGQLGPLVSRALSTSCRTT